MTDTTVKLMECVLADDGVLRIERVGVGVGITLYSVAQKTAAGVHILAPDSVNPTPENPAKYANTAIPYAVDQLEKKGVKPPFSIALTGGAVMPGSPPQASMGPKVVAAVKDALKKASLNIKVDETGGSQIRSIILDTKTGNTRIEIAPAK